MALGLVGVSHWTDLAAQETEGRIVCDTLLGAVAAALADSKLVRSVTYPDVGRFCPFMPVFLPSV